MNHGPKLACAVALAVIALNPRISSAQELKVQLKLVQKKKDPVDDGKAPPETPPDPVASWVPPQFRAVITARPGLVAKDFALKQADVQPPLLINAEKSVTFLESDEPMTLVVLVQGNFRWLGNDPCIEEGDTESARYEGAFQGLGPAIDALAKMGPPKSRAALLVYTDGRALVKQPMGDATALQAGSLGNLKEYCEFISIPLIVGLTEAWKLLTTEDAAETRKILVVIGDGTDDAEDIDAPLKKIIEDLKKAGVESYSIHYVAKVEDSPQGQQNMKKIGSEQHHSATSRNQFPTFAGSIAQYVGGKYYVDFPSTEVKLDGKTHDFSVQVGKDESAPIAIELPEPPVKPKKKSRWWLWLIIGLAALLLVIIIIVLIVRRRRRRRVPEPEPEIEVPDPEPAMRKTVMLGIGGTEDSIPIVGWIVPLHGPEQFQTFKLLQGATKLGTGGAAHIVVSDEFMSTEHAEIVCSQSGFILNDLGSTNGTYLNQRRVSSHELVDNDVFVLGQTDFKFKSIN